MLPQGRRGRRPAQHRLTFAKRSEDLIAALGHGVHVGGGTAWLWSRPDAFETVDVLFVDEAARWRWPTCWPFRRRRRRRPDRRSAAARPADAGQPSGRHGCFGAPPHSWRRTHDPGRQGSVPRRDLAAASRYLRLYLRAVLRRQARSKPDLKSRSSGGGTGQRRRDCATCRSPIRQSELFARRGGGGRRLVNGILDSKATWIDRDGESSRSRSMISSSSRPTTRRSLKSSSACRARVSERSTNSRARRPRSRSIRRRHRAMPMRRAAWIPLQPEPAQRRDFARQCVSLLIGAPQLFEAECRTPRQMQLANAFCRYRDGEKRSRCPAPQG